MEVFLGMVGIVKSGMEQKLNDLECPDWLEGVGDLPDHYHGFSWDGGVMPNNLLFFLRQSAEEMRPLGVSHCLHSRYEMVIPYAGGGDVCVDGVIYELRPGCVLLLPPGAFHYFFNLPEDGFSWLFCTFELEASLASPEAMACPRELSEWGYAQIAEASQLYVSSNVSKSSIFEVGLKIGRVLQGLQHKTKVLPLPDPAASDVEACQLLRTLIEFVDERMDDALRISDLAQHVGRSESYLRKTFRESYGTSLGQFLQRSRLTNSVRLIGLNDKSISEIARLCGFESISSFSQSFTRAIGMSPTAYRQHLLAGCPPIKISIQGDHARTSPAA